MVGGTPRKLGWLLAEFGTLEVDVAMASNRAGGMRAEFGQAVDPRRHAAG